MDRPILFSAPMIRALREGRKTQTRRILKLQPIQFAIDDAGTLCDVGCLHINGDRRPRIKLGRVVTLQELPYAAGDRLWVKETWRTSVCQDAIKPSIMETPGNGYGWPVWYEADGGTVTWRGSDGGGPGFENAGKLRPSIFMPRWASRLTLLVTDVRVERLQSISEADAAAEGLIKLRSGRFAVNKGEQYAGLARYTARARFGDLWSEINGPESWEANPWIVAVSFVVQARNINDLPEVAA